MQAGIGQPCGEACRADAIEQVDRRHVERQAQRLRDTNRAVEGAVEIGRTIVAKGLRRIDQQAFGMDQAIIEGKPVEERFQRRAGRAPGSHHVDMAEARLVAKQCRADIGQGSQVVVVDDEQGRRRALGQPRQIAADAILHAALQFNVDGRRDAALLGMIVVQATRQQGGTERRLQGACDDRFYARILHLGGRPHGQAGHALKYLVACRACGLRFAIRSQAARCLRQHGEQCGFGA